MEFVNRVADEAEAMDHHPDILIHGWNKVRLSVMTHSEGGLTGEGFQARQIGLTDWFRAMQNASHSFSV